MGVYVDEASPIRSSLSLPSYGFSLSRNYSSTYFRPLSHLISLASQGLQGASERDELWRTSRMGSITWIQALMLWKRLYGHNIWAHDIDELEGLNKDFKRVLGEHAELRALSLKDIRTLERSQEVADIVCARRRVGNRTVVIPCDRGSESSGLRHELPILLYWQDGLRRHLTAAEIVEQAVYARRLLSADIGSITNEGERSALTKSKKVGDWPLFFLTNHAGQKLDHAN